MAKAKTCKNGRDRRFKHKTVCRKKPAKKRRNAAAYAKTALAPTAYAPTMRGHRRGRR